MMGKTKALLLCGASLLAMGNATMAAAETDGGEELVILERIVVGAGTGKVAVDTPQAVTVKGQDDIDRDQPVTVGDLFWDVPGVTAIGSDRIGGQSINIRGIGSLAAADESKIIITIDGATKFYEQYRLGSVFTDPELYKRVEVLRGPASSTLYGSGALGGVINFTTKDGADFLKPGQNTVVRLKTTLDSNKEGVLGSFILAQRLGALSDILLTGNFRRANEYVNGDGVPIAGSDFESWSGLAKLTHRFGHNGEQVLRLSYQRWRSDADDTEYSQTGTLGFGTIDRLITDTTAVVSYENPVSDNPWINLKVNFSYSNTEVKQDDSSFPPISPLFLPSEYGYRTLQAKIENTAEFKGASFVNYLTTGIQISHQTRTAETTSGGLSFHPEGTDRKIGLYFQNEFIWNEKLTIIPGARVDFIALDPDSGLSGATKSDDVAFSPKIAVHYRFNKTFAIFGSVAHTERTPTLDELYSTAAPDADYPGGRTYSTLSGEASNNYEAGFSVSGRDLIVEGDVAHLKATAFYNDLTNLITVNPNLGQAFAVPYYVNISAAEIYGIEIEAAYKSDRWFGNLAYSHVEGEDKSTGLTLNTIPADTVAVTLGGRVPDKKLEFAWKARFAGAISTGATTGPFKAYQVHSAYVSWKPDQGTFSGWEMQASVENIFDEQYRNNLAGDDGKGRTFKLTLAKTLGW